MKPLKGPRKQHEPGRIAKLTKDEKPDIKRPPGRPPKDVSS